jgi:uncharacterized membrane protein
MAVQLVLVVLYMVVTHLAVVLQSDRLALISINLLALILLLGPLKQRRPWAYLVMATLIAMVYVGSGARLAQAVIFLPPIVVNMGLCWLFGHTLVGNSTPLVVRMVRLLHGKDDLTAQILRYARRVTEIWTGLFLFNAVVCLVLALCATPGGLLLMAGYRPMFTAPVRDWSLFSDLGCNVLVGLMFVVEYMYRRRLFPSQPYRNFFDFLRRAAAIGPALLAGLKR